ncbi:MFS transporter [Cordyceps militaris]|uniref:MFS transporter n=1 Tax=Cordyceps militaris TaxID=73501 RepID=A0A2H4SMA2_CORMI|nr:MFS transporter [Cordyceps militaris]
MRSTWQHLSLINRTLFAGNPIVGILLFSTVFITLGKSVVMFLLQYVAKRFGWSWAKASLLIGIKYAVSIGLTAIVLPTLSQVLLKTGMAPHIKDWWIVRVSAMIGVLGALAMGMAPTVELFISALIFTEFGGGLQVALRGLVTELVDQSHIALVMTVLGMFMTISEMVAGPLMAQMFKVGMDWGGFWNDKWFTDYGTKASYVNEYEQD